MLNAKHKTQNAKHKTQNTKHKTQNAKHKTQNAKTQNPKPYLNKLTSSDVNEIRVPIIEIDTVSAVLNAEDLDFGSLG